MMTARSLAVALLLACASASAPHPHRIRASAHIRTTMLPVVPPRHAPATMTAISNLKTAVVECPSTVAKTLRGWVGIQPVAWGLAGMLAPEWIVTTCFGGSLTATNALLLRSLAVSQLVLGTRIYEGTNDNAAATGFVLFAGWFQILRHVLATGTVGAYTSVFVAWNALNALVAARGQGSLFETGTHLDVKALDAVLPRDSKLSIRNFIGVQFDAVLPRDSELSIRNFIGVQFAAGGVMKLLFQNFVTGPSVLGLVAATAKGAVAVDGATAAAKAITGLALSGAGLSGILLGGQTFGGSDRKAAANGLVVFGGWAAVVAAGKTAGYFTGQYLGLVFLWDVLMAAYCAYTLVVEKWVSRD